jgi:hypothetical protein
VAALTQIRALRSHLFRRPAPVLLRAPQRTPKTPQLFREIPHDLRKSSGVFCAQRASSGAACEAPCRQMRRHTHLLAPFRATCCPFPAVSDAPERFFVLLSYILPPTGQKDALPQNNSTNAAHSTPTVRVETAPIPSPESPKKPVDAAAPTGFFVE